MQSGIASKQKLAIFLISIFACCQAFSQTTGGTLRGIVKDKSGLVVDQSVISVFNEATGAHFRTNSDGAGLYVFPNLLPGSYKATIENKGFSKFVRQNVVVYANKVTDLDATLYPAGANIFIVVVDGAPLVSTSSSQLGAVFPSQIVTDLPNSVLGGSPLNLATILPNTTTQAGGIQGVGGSIGGNRPRNNNFTIDGVDNNDLANTGPLQPVIRDSVAEFDIITNQFSAEYGHSTGGQFNVITKSGSNQHHGDLFYYGRNRQLDAMDNLTKSAVESGEISGKPRFDYQRFGGVLGGAIVKDKLFYFGAFEYRSLGREATAPTVISPTQSGLTMLNGMAADSAVKNILAQFPAALQQTSTIVVNNQQIPIGSVQYFAPDYENQYDFQTNIDYNVGNHQLRSRFLFDRVRSPNANSSLPLPQFTGSVATDSRKVLLTDVWSVNPKLVNDVRVSYSRYLQDLRIPEAFANFPNVTISGLDNLNIGPNSLSPQGSFQHVYQVLDNINYLAGRHQLKAGIEYRNAIVSYEALPKSRGEWDYSSLDEFINDRIPGGINSLSSAQRGVGIGSFTGNQQSINWFVQDDIRAGKNLTFNLGMRYEYTSNPRDAALQSMNSIATLPGIFEFRAPKSDKNNFGPRFGFAYAPDFQEGILAKIFGNSGQSSIRGGFGVAYDVNFQNMDVITMPPQRQSTQYPSLACMSANSAPAWCSTQSGFLAGGGLPQINVAPTTQAEARAATNYIIVDQVAPKTYTWSLSLQREFAKNYSLELRYLGTQGMNLPVQTWLNTISVFENHPELALPTYLSPDAVPARMSLTAPNLMQFEYAQDLRYSASGFFGPVGAFLPVGKSIYHGGSVELKRRFANNLFLIANYTWSRTMDDATAELASSLVNPRRPQNSYNMNNEWALSALDMPHKFTLNWIYELPKAKGASGALKQIVNGWQINGSFLAESGQPITAISGQDANGDFDNAADRAIYNPNGTQMAGSLVKYLVRDPATGAITTTASHVVDYGPEDAKIVGYVAVNPNAKYVVAMPGTPEDGRRVGRNTIRSIGLNNWNLSAFKGFELQEGRQLQFRAEFFNAFNHRQKSIGLPTYEQYLGNALSSSYANVSSSQFLDAGQFSGGNRSVQMSLKLIF